MHKAKITIPALIAFMAIVLLLVWQEASPFAKLLSHTTTVKQIWLVYYVFFGLVIAKIIGVIVWSFK